MIRCACLVASLAFALAMPSAINAQPPDRLIRVAYIDMSATPVQMASPAGRRWILDALAARGYVEGRNLVYDARTAEGDIERIPAIVADLVRLKTDVIVVGFIAMAMRARQVTTTVPIFSMAGDPVLTKLAESLNRPGGNVNGITAAGIITVEQKRLQLLHELAPKARRIAFVSIRPWWDTVWGQSLREAASALGLQAVYIESTLGGFEGAFAALRKEKPDAVFFEPSPAAMSHRRAIGEFARASGIPSACGHEELVRAGCLMTYNFTNAEGRRALADFVDRIAKGAKAGELPYHQYDKYEFALNMKTAKAIGLTIPQTVLLRVDQVIE